MTAQVISINEAMPTKLDAAEHEYLLAEEHFQQVTKNACMWRWEDKKRFNAAIERRDKARKRYIDAMRA